MAGVFAIMVVSRRGLTIILLLFLLNAFVFDISRSLGGWAASPFEGQLALALRRLT